MERSRARAFLDILASRPNLVLKSKEETKRLSKKIEYERKISTLLDQKGVGPEQLLNITRGLGINYSKDESQDFDLLVQTNPVDFKTLSKSVSSDMALVELK